MDGIVCGFDALPLVVNDVGKDFNSVMQSEKQNNKSKEEKQFVQGSFSNSTCLNVCFENKFMLVNLFHWFAW